MAQNEKAKPAAPGTEAVAAAPAQQLQINVRLQPANDSDQPIFANFTVAQGAAAMVFIDFGFLDPSALPALARLAQSGGKMPEAINGRLACRVAMGLDSVAQLAQQLNQVLQNATAQARAAAEKSSAGK